MSREERKVVTVLFTDLVGFTGRSEELDPEDVRATRLIAAERGDLAQLEPARAYFAAKGMIPFIKRSDAVLAASA